MIHRARYDPNLEIETLQTDIMRFMAILGFCLMTIFALVQSIPTGKADARPRLELKQTLEDQIADLASTLAALEARRALIEQEYVVLLNKQDAVTQEILKAETIQLEKNQNMVLLEEQEKALVQEKQSIEDRLREQQQTLKEVQVKLQEKQQRVATLASQAQSTQTQLKEVRLKVAREKRSLNVLVQQINAADDNLTAVQRHLQEKQLKQKAIESSLTVLQEQKQDASKALSELDQNRQQQIVALNKIKQSVAQKQKEKEKLNQQVAQVKKAKIAQQKKIVKKTIKKVKPKVAAATPKPEKKGFSLRFGSDRVLTTLVRQGLIDFYAMTQNKAFRVYNGAFEKASKPHQFHQMTVDTVPKAYQTLLRRKYTFYRSNSIIWGVVLPGAIKTKIQAITSKHRGGDIVIRSGGSVILE